MGKLTSFFKGLTGQKVLERSDLEAPLAKMKDLLIVKNVATDIAENLCESVLQSLVGKSISSFKGFTQYLHWCSKELFWFYLIKLLLFLHFSKGVASVVREGMEKALQRILTPKKSTDLLRFLFYFISVIFLWYCSVCASSSSTSHNPPSKQTNKRTNEQTKKRNTYLQGTKEALFHRVLWSERSW